MDYYANFQKVIDYIEQNLTEEIDYKILAQILGTNEQFLQVIFTFITNTSLTEYIKKRRFSRAYEELKSTNIRVIDLAIKYHYSSETSFSRAFKSYFNITPSECRNEKNEFMLFPVFELPKIRELYQELKDKGLFNMIVKDGMYAVTFKDKKNEEVYWVGCKKELPFSEKIVIEKGRYLVFNCNGATQSDVVTVISNIWSHFIKSSKFKLDEQYFFEKYEKNENCFLYMKVKE